MITIKSQVGYHKLVSIVYVPPIFRFTNSMAVLPIFWASEPIFSISTDKNHIIYGFTPYYAEKTNCLICITYAENSSQRSIFIFEFVVIHIARFHAETFSISIGLQNETHNGPHNHNNDP